MTYISTAGHGFLKVTISQLKKAMKNGFEPTSFSFVNKSGALLEEDVDAGEFLRAYYGEDDYQEKAKSIKDKYQDDINREKYQATPPTLAELEEQLNIYDQSLWSVGDIMKTYNNEEYAIIGRQSNGYIYREGGTRYCMPFARIIKITKSEELAEA